MKKHGLGFVLLPLLAVAAGQPRPVTVDDEMKLRAIVDVRIAPTGQTVAHVVSTPSLAKERARGGALRRPGTFPQFMTKWIVTQAGRFKAASAGASISDLAGPYYLSEGGEFMVEYFKRPWENADSYAAHSPLTWAKRVTTPLLIQHGERDPHVPIAGAWKFYRALKAIGKTVEFDIYPRGGHVLYEPMLQREAMRRNLGWFSRWILAPR